VADAAAFAGAQDLTNVGLATNSAEDYVTLNGSEVGDATVTISQTNSANDTIEVKVDRKVSFTFLRAIGLEGTTVSAKAKVRIAAYSGGGGLLPWGFVASNNSNSELLQNSCYIGNDANGVPKFQQNMDCTVKFGAGSNEGGDFGALALDGNGANIYGDSIANGSSNKWGVGDKVEPQTGNMQGKTGQGLAVRLAKAAPGTCTGNSRSDVLMTMPDGTVAIRAGCESSPRIGIVPVVDQIDGAGQSLSTILGFAFVFIKGESGNGGDTKVDVEFVTFVTEIPDSVYNGTDPNGTRIVKLIE
ncbi:MAG: hypothetical protein WED87_06200, partial [Dehalococcoidia bacterium]